MVIPHQQPAPKSGRSFADRGSSSIINPVLDWRAPRQGQRLNRSIFIWAPAARINWRRTPLFIWANFARDLARNILGPAELPGLPVLTNINDTCNAFWNGSSINFFKAGNGCPNTAYSDVVMHEYGHGIDAVKSGIVHGGYSEGFGDAMAVLATRQPCVGRDFFGAGTCLRSASDVIHWPSPGNVHTQSRPYGGFTWELVQQLKQTFSETVLTPSQSAGAQRCGGQSVRHRRAVHLSFIVDDNDANLTNGTPHFRALANAADSRKIPRPADPQVGVPSSAPTPRSPGRR